VSNMIGERDPLFCYCLAVGGREFAIRVGRDGTIHWDDYQQRRTSRPGEEAVLMTEPDEFTVSFELGPELLARFRQAAALLKINAWTAEDETRLDEALIPLFWKRVNGGLTHPLARPLDEMP
jgi:hypothetical protein